MLPKLILLADDHVIIRRGLKLLLDNYFNRDPLIEAESTKDILLQLEKYPITHMILDMQLQDGNVMEILPTIKRKYPQAHILIYTMSSEDIFGVKMLKMGATSFLSKQSDEEEVVKALNLFLSGRTYTSNNLKDILGAVKNQKSNPLQALSERELSVLGRLLKGESVKEISNQLALKPTTVATYKARIFEKLGVNNIIDLNNIADLNNFQNP
jgi:two-component system, NarL family, invasion response regulator UvrY